jgi:hypothetical protein
METGWIKLHRKFRESTIYRNHIAVVIWLECLFRASLENRKVLFGRNVINVKKGAFWMGSEEMASTVGCSRSTVERYMKIFQKLEMLNRVASNKGTLCEVKNWEQYQQVRTTTEQQRNNNGTTTEHKEEREEEKEFKNNTTRARESVILKNENTTKTEKEENEEIEKSILKWFSKMCIENPEGYFLKIKKSCDWPAIKKAWKDAKRGVGIENTSQFYSRCIHYQKPTLSQQSAEKSENSK